MWSFSEFVLFTYRWPAHVKTFHTDECRCDINLLKMISKDTSWLSREDDVHVHNVLIALQWRHNDQDGVSNHQPRGCLLNRLFRRRSKKTSKLRVTGLCVGNSPGPVNSPHKGPVTRKMFPFDDVIMCVIKASAVFISSLSCCTQGCFLVCTQPVSKGVTMKRHLSLAEPIPRMIPVYAKVLFHNYFSLSGEQPEQRVSAHTLWQLISGFLAIFHKYCWFTEHGDIITNFNLRNPWGILLISQNNRMRVYGA